MLAAAPGRRARETRSAPSRRGRRPGAGRRPRLSAPGWRRRGWSRSAPRPRPARPPRSRSARPGRAGARPPPRPAQGARGSAPRAPPRPGVGRASRGGAPPRARPPPGRRAAEARRGPRPAARRAPARSGRLGLRRPSFAVARPDLGDAEWLPRPSKALWISCGVADPFPRSISSPLAMIWASLNNGALGMALPPSLRGGRRMGAGLGGRRRDVERISRVSIEAPTRRSRPWRPTTRRARRGRRSRGHRSSGRRVVGQLVGRSARRSVSQFVGRLVDRSVGRRVGVTSVNVVELGRWPRGMIRRLWSRWTGWDRARRGRCARRPRPSCSGSGSATRRSARRARRRSAG